MICESKYASIYGVLLTLSEKMKFILYQSKKKVKQLPWSLFETCYGHNLQF